MTTPESRQTNQVDPCLPAGEFLAEPQVAGEQLSVEFDPSVSHDSTFACFASVADGSANVVLMMTPGLLRVAVVAVVAVVAKLGGGPR